MSCYEKQKHLVITMNSTLVTYLAMNVHLDHQITC